jgi:hypothetical protein
MPARSTSIDPMAHTKINGAVWYERRIDSDGFGFYTLDVDNLPIPMTYYDVITDICRCFNARLYMSGGVFNFVNPFTAYTATTARAFRYTKALTGTGADENWRASVDKSAYARDTGGTDTLLPQAYKVESTYLHLTGNNIIALPYYIASTTPYTIGAVLAGTGNKINLKYNNLVSVIKTASPTVSFQYYSYHKLTIKIGAYYLVGDDYLTHITSWSLTPGYFSHRKLFMAAANGGFVDTISIITPDIPADGVATFEVEFDKVELPNGINAAGDFSNYTCVFYAASVGFLLNDEALMSFTFDSTLSGTPNTKYTIDAGETYIGDGITNTSPGALKVYTGSAWVYSGSQWRRKDTGTAYPIGQLRVLEIHGLCYKSVYMLQGSIFGRQINMMPDIDRRYYYINEDYVCQLGTYDYDEQTMSGEWYKMTGHLMTETTGGGSGKKWPVPTGSNPSDDPGILYQITNNYITAATIALSDDGLTPGDEITEIPVTLIGRAVFNVGDEIIIFDPSTGNYQELTIDDIQAAEDEAISVVLATILYNFPAGSRIMYAGAFEARFLQNRPEVVEVLDSTNLLTSHLYSHLRVNKGTAATVTIPDDDTLRAQIGAVVVVEQAGVGAVSVANAEGVTIIGDTTVTARYGTITLTKVASNTWHSVASGSSVEQYWQRNTTTLSPATAGDNVEVTANNTNGAVKGAGTTGKGVIGSSTSNYGVQGGSSSSYGMYGQSTTGIGIGALSGTNYALQAISALGIPAFFQRSSANTNTIEIQAIFRRNATSAGGNGIGLSFDYEIFNSASASPVSVRHIYKLTDVTNGAEDAAYEIWLLSGGVLAVKLTLSDIGKLWTPSATIGDVAGGDYTEIEPDGTIRFHGDATVWRDELNELVGKQLTTPGSDIVQNLTEQSLEFKSSADIGDYVNMSIQLNHDRKLGSDIEPHIHWEQTSADTPNWLIAYRWQIQGGTKTTTWTYQRWTDSAAEWSSGTLNQITSFGYITPPEGDGISDIVQFRIFRDFDDDSELFGDIVDETYVPSEDPISGSVYATMFDIHIEIDTVGSRQLYVK